MGETKPAYLYYKQVVDEEHLLSCTEIAAAYSITTKTNRPHGRLVAAVIEVFLSKTKDGFENQLYYSTKNGMMKVYKKELYSMIAPFIIDLVMKKQEIVIDGKKYSAYVEDEKEKAYTDLL